MGAILVAKPGKQLVACLAQTRRRTLETQAAVSVAMWTITWDPMTPRATPVVVAEAGEDGEEVTAAAVEEQEVVTAEAAVAVVV